MAERVRMALAELLRKADAEPDLDTLREGVRVMTQALMELEVAQHLGAERYQRSPERQGEPNGYRDRNWETRVGTLELHVPRVRDGSFFPGLLEPRKRAERAHWWPPCASRTSRCQHPQGGRSGQSPRARWHQQVRSAACVHSWTPRWSVSAAASSRATTRTFG